MLLRYNSILELKQAFVLAALVTLSDNWGWWQMYVGCRVTEDFAFASVLLQLFRRGNEGEGGRLRINTYTNKTNFYHKAKQKQTNKEKIKNSSLTPALRKTRGLSMLGASLQKYVSGDRPCWSQLSILPTWAFNFRIHQHV